MLKIRPLLPFLVASLLAAAALALPAGPVLASDLPSYPFVHVPGTSFRMELPDIATLDFEIVAVDADPALARAVLGARAGEIRDLMHQLDMDMEDLTVRETRQTIRKDEKSANGGSVYELRCDVHINVRNVSNWTRLADGLFGKANLDSFSPAFDNSAMNRITDEMMAEAIEDARHNAGVIAQASGRRLGQVMAVTPSALMKLGTAMGLERDEFKNPRRSGTTGAGDVEREQLMMIPALKLRQPVDVIFRLENAPRARTRTARQP